MLDDGDCVAIFHSIHRVMKAENILLEAAVDFLLIPVPRQLSADCGMAIRLAATDLDQIVALLGRHGLNIAEAWRFQDRQFERLF